MSVDFTPSRGEYTELKPFRYWCQKVLPLVYDDSLSYYELLSKILDALNKAMEDVETLNDDMTALYTAYTALQNWVTAYAEDLQNWVNNYVETFFEGEGIADAVDAGIDRMVVSGEFGSIVNDKVAAQINAVVASQLGTVVQGQLPSVVQAQIPGVVSSQLPGMVNNQIGDIVEDWLEANITPDTTLLDRTINATNKAPVAYDIKNMIQSMKSNYSFIDKFTMFDYPGAIDTGLNDLPVLEYPVRTYGDTVSHKTIFMQYVKKGNSLNLYNANDEDIHCYPSLIPITRNLLPPISSEFAIVNQTIPTIPNVATSYNKNAILTYFVNLKSKDTIKIVVDIPITVTGNETPVVCLTGWKLVKIYVSNNNIVTQNLADFTVTGSVADGKIHAECEYTFGDINKEAYQDPATVGFGLAILTGDTSVELTTYQESGFEEGVTYSDNTNFFPKGTGFNMTITGEVVDTEVADLNERLNLYYTIDTDYITDWYQGWIRDDGTFGTSTTNCRTGMITYSSDLVTLEIKNGYKYALFEYTTSSGGLVQKHFRGRTDKYTFEPDPSHYYAIEIAKIDGTTLNPTDVPGNVLSETNIYITDTTLSKAKKPADAKVTGDAITNISSVANSANTKVNDITEYATIPGYDTNDNLLDGLTLQTGYYGDNNGFVNNSNFSYLSVDVSGVTKIKIGGTHHTYTTAQFDQLGVFVDSNGDLVKSIKTQYGSTPVSEPYEIEIPTGATTLRLNTDYSASSYPTTLPSGLYVYPFGMIAKYYVPTAALEQAPITLEELSDGTKNLKLIAGVVRNKGTGWEYINDTNHEPLNLSDVYVDENGKLVIEYSFTASKVLSLVATPDEDFANKYTIGGSVGLDKTLFNVCTMPQEIGGKVTISNGTPDVTASTFTGFTINASTGEIRLTHSSLSHIPSKYVFNISVHCDNYTVVYGSQGYDYVSIYLKDSNGTIIKDITGLSFSIYATRNVASVQINANNVVSANGNFWIYGVMEIN